MSEPATTPRILRKARILKTQRARRAKLRRIDYYPSDKAAAIVDAQIRPCVGGDYSSVISRIVEEWSGEFRNKSVLAGT